MNQEHRRNIGIFAHVDAGKTTTTEYILYESGRIRSLGKVDEGTSQTDSLDVERERGISVKAANASFTWRNHEINLVDTPGHVDFLSEVERSMRVMDGAVLIVSAVEGVQSQTEVIWHALRSMNIPTVIYMNKMDRIGADEEKVLGQIHSLLSPMAAPVQIPSGVEERFTGSVPVWESSSALDGILEKLAETDEELMVKYILGERLDEEELRMRLTACSRSGKAFPVLYGCSSRGIGIPELLDALLDYLPAPAGEANGPVSGVVYKIERDKAMGRTAYVRLYSGTIRNRDSVRNVTRGVDEKITQIRKIDGGKQQDIGVLEAGDIAAVFGMAEAQIGDILGSPAGVPPEHRIAIPLLTVRVHWTREQDYPVLATALQELTEEDPLLDLKWHQQERELHVKVMGPIQLEILTELLKARFGLEATFGPPAVIYKETPAREGEGFFAYTMPKPCWAILRFHIKPGARGSGLVYRSIERPERLLVSYQNEVERRVPQALQQGLKGWEVTDLEVTLIEGEHHVWHTHPLDFVVATPVAVMEGLARTGTVLLEPILHYRISVPEELGGRVLSDLVRMRAEFQPPKASGGRMVVEGKVPAATSFDYSVSLSSLTGGKGTITTSFAGYEECPGDVEAVRPRIGVDPLDHSKYILSVRNAISREG